MDVKRFLIYYNVSLKEALEKLNETAKKILFVVDDKDRLIGALSDGDVRRWILKGNSNFSVAIESVCNKNPIYFLKDSYDFNEVKKVMIEKRIESIPIVDENKKVVDILFLDELLEESYSELKPKLDIPVVIMAGGKGKRLDPFTRILPKPLIPVGDKAMLEIILDNFREYSINEFYLIVNYKSEMIKSYLDNIPHQYILHYIKEEKYLGTAGGLQLLPENIKDNFFVSNCDIILREDYSKIYSFHLRKKSDITIVASMESFKVPYGVVKIRDGGILEEIIEKPEYDFLVNIGVYIINKRVISKIPKKRPFDMTDLIKEVKGSNGIVNVYPISHKSWYDIGQWREYIETLKAMGVYVEKE